MGKIMEKIPSLWVCFVTRDVLQNRYFFKSSKHTSRPRTPKSPPGANLQFDSCPVKVGVCLRGNCPDSYQVLIWCFPFGKISIFMIMYMV